MLQSISLRDCLLGRPTRIGRCFSWSVAVPDAASLLVPVGKKARKRGPLDFALPRRFVHEARQSGSTRSRLSILVDSTKALGMHPPVTVDRLRFSTRIVEV